MVGDWQRTGTVIYLQEPTLARPHAPLEAVLRAVARLGICTSVGTPFVTRILWQIKWCSCGSHRDTFLREDLRCLWHIPSLREVAECTEPVHDALDEIRVMQVADPERQSTADLRVNPLAVSGMLQTRELHDLGGKIRDFSLVCIRRIRAQKTHVQIAFTGVPPRDNASHCRIDGLQKRRGIREENGQFRGLRLLTPCVDD